MTIYGVKMNKVNLFLDSGAFSAFTKGATIDIQEYIAFIKENLDVIETYANLDVIGDPAGTLNNQKIMEASGLKPLPCFHYGEDIDYLEYYLSKYDYLALGGMVPISTGDLIPWLDSLFGEYICGPDGMPRIKIHGFGLTSLKLMMRYPWYCMTEEDHEVLTKQGWKSRSTLVIGEEILAFDQGKAIWQKVEEIPTFQVSNQEIIRLSNRNFDARITSNHRWLVSNMNKRDINYKQKTTDTLLAGDCINRVGKYDFPIIPIYTNEQISLLAWFWTDGTIKKRPKYKNDNVVIYQSERANAEKCALIRKALLNSQESSCESKATDGTVSFELYGKISKWILSIAPNKELPIELAFSLTKEQAQLFIDHSVLADGTISGLKRTRGFEFCVKKESKQKSFEIIRIICLLLGIPTSIYHSKDKYMGLRSSSVNHIYVNQLKKERIIYTGNLWCVKVAAGAFFTKCNNKIYVTGNSVDSASWVMTGRMGSVLVPKRGDYLVDPFKVAVSDRSPSKGEAGKHFKTFSPMEQDIITEYLDHKGYKIGSSEFRFENKNYKPVAGERWHGPARSDSQREVELVIEPGLSNDYMQRDELNIIYFLDLEAALPAWPWAFKLKTNHAVKGGFGL
jgi:hypothetical protein